MLNWGLDLQKGKQIQHTGKKERKEKDDQTHAVFMKQVNYSSSSY